MKKGATMMSKKAGKLKNKMDFANQIEKRVLEALKDYCLNGSYSIRNSKVPAIKRGMTLAEDLNMDALDIAEAVITVEGAFSDEGLYIPSDAEIRTTDDLIFVVQKLLRDSYGKVGGMTARERAKDNGGDTEWTCRPVDMTFREAEKKGMLSMRAANAVRRCGHGLIDKPVSSIVSFTKKRNLSPCAVHLRDGTTLKVRGFGEEVGNEIMKLKMVVER